MERTTLGSENNDFEHPLKDALDVLSPDAKRLLRVDVAKLAKDSSQVEVNRGLDVYYSTEVVGNPCHRLSDVYLIQVAVVVVEEIDLTHA